MSKDALGLGRQMGPEHVRTEALRALAQRDELIAEFRALLGRDAVIADQSGLEVYENDGLTAYAQKPMVAVLPAEESMRRLRPAAPCYGTCLGAHSSVLDLFIAGPLLERQGQVNPQQLWGQQLWDRSTHLAP